MSFFVVMTSVFLTLRPRLGALPLSTNFHGAIVVVLHGSLGCGPEHFGDASPLILL